MVLQARTGGQQLQSSVVETVKSLGGLQGVLRSIGTGQIAPGIVEAARELVQLRIRLEALGPSAEEADRNFDLITQSAQKLPGGLQAAERAFDEFRARGIEPTQE